MPARAVVGARPADVRRVERDPVDRGARRRASRSASVRAATCGKRMNEPASPACSRLVHIVGSTGGSSVVLTLTLPGDVCKDRFCSLRRTRFCMSSACWHVRPHRPHRAHDDGPERRDQGGRRRGGCVGHHRLARAQRQGPARRRDARARPGGSPRELDYRPSAMAREPRRRQDRPARVCSCPSRAALRCASRLRLLHRSS